VVAFFVKRQGRYFALRCTFGRPQPARLRSLVIGRGRAGFERRDADARPVSEVEGVVGTSLGPLLGGKKRHMVGPLKSTSVQSLSTSDCFSAATL